jgi:hypothetical protein
LAWQIIQLCMRRAAAGARIALEEQLSEAEAAASELLADLEHKGEVILVQASAIPDAQP